MNARDRETLESVLDDLVRLLADDERFAILRKSRRSDDDIEEVLAWWKEQES